MGMEGLEFRCLGKRLEQGLSCFFNATTIIQYPVSRNLTKWMILNISPVRSDQQVVPQTGFMAQPLSSAHGGQPELTDG
jgi:hypothetical protein